MPHRHFSRSIAIPGLSPTSFISPSNRALQVILGLPLPLLLATFACSNWLHNVQFASASVMCDVSLGRQRVQSWSTLCSTWFARRPRAVTACRASSWPTPSGAAPGRAWAPCSSARSGRSTPTESCSPSQSYPRPRCGGQSSWNLSFTINRWSFKLADPSSCVKMHSTLIIR